jgi:hypothetical protein
MNLRVKKWGMASKRPNMNSRGRQPTVPQGITLDPIGVAPCFNLGFTNLFPGSEVSKFVPTQATTLSPSDGERDGVRGVPLSKGSKLEAGTNLFWQFSPQ